MSNSLLPPNATEFMRNAVAASGRLSELPVDIWKLWNVDICPVKFLPYLAWALSVDRWDEGWTEQTKRQVIRTAWRVHRLKGTIAALRGVVEPFGYLIRIIEWFETGEAPGTFRLDIGISEQGITEDIYIELERLLADAKPLTRHLVGLSIQLETAGATSVAAGCYMGDELTVYPYMPDDITTAGNAAFSAGVYLIDTVSVNYGS